MKQYITIGTVLLLTLICSGCKEKEVVLNQAETQLILERYRNILDAANDLSQVPRSIDENGTLVTTSIYGWTSGFFAGTLWYLYEWTGDEQWKEEAVKWTEALIQFSIGVETTMWGL